MKKHRGFAAMAIVVLLATACISAFILWPPASRYPGLDMDRTVWADLERIAQAARFYKADTGVCPASAPVLRTAGYIGPDLPYFAAYQVVSNPDATIDIFCSRLAASADALCDSHGNPFLLRIR